MLNRFNFSRCSICYLSARYDNQNADVQPSLPIKMCSTQSPSSRTKHYSTFFIFSAAAVVIFSISGLTWDFRMIPSMTSATSFEHQTGTFHAVITEEFIINSATNNTRMPTNRTDSASAEANVSSTTTNKKSSSKLLAQDSNRKDVEPDFEEPSFAGQNNNPNNHTDADPSPWAALCAVAADEDNYITEWADYHLGLGFGHIYVYDNSLNHTLKQWGLEKEGVQTIHHVSNDLKNIQQNVYMKCVESLRKLSHPPFWVMFLDGDEFLALRDGRYHRVDDFLSDHLTAGALQINWLVFGTANQTKYSPDPVTKRFQYRMEEPDVRTKTVAVLDHIDRMEVHYASLKKGYSRIGMGGKKVGVAGALCCLKNGDTSVAAVHHYKYKSEEEFRRKSCVRGRINNGKSKCGEDIRVGEVFDDVVWQALKRNVPAYAERYPDKTNESMETTE